MIQLEASRHNVELSKMITLGLVANTMMTRAIAILFKLDLLCFCVNF